MKMTLNIDEVAKLCGVCRTTIHKEISKHGTVCGVPVIRVGAGGQRQRTLIPLAPLLRTLGLDELPEGIIGTRSK